MGCARRARGQRSSTPTCARGALVVTSVDAREKLRGLRVRCHLFRGCLAVRHNRRAATRAFHAPRLARAHRPDARRLALLCPPHPPSAPLPPAEGCDRHVRGVVRHRRGGWRAVRLQLVVRLRQRRARLRHATHAHRAHARGTLHGGGRQGALSVVPLQGHRRARPRAARRRPKRGRRILPRRMARLQGVRVRGQEALAQGPDHDVRRRRVDHRHGPRTGRLRAPRVLCPVRLRAAPRPRRVRLVPSKRLARRVGRHPRRPAAGLPQVRRARDVDARAGVRGVVAGG